MNILIRPAAPEDSALIYALVQALATYEKLDHEVAASEDDIAAALFGPAPKLFGLIAELDHQPVGFALWFYNFSTFLGRHGIYLEDLFVRPEARGQGVGRALLAALARRCVVEKLGRLEWSVLDWNQPAIRFYQSIGAELKRDWIGNRLTGEALLQLGEYGS